MALSKSEKKMCRLSTFIKKIVLPSIFFFLSFNAFSLSFTAGTEIDNVFFTSERLTLASDGSIIIETEPFKIPVFLGLGFSMRFIQKDVKRDLYYFNQNYDDFYFNKGFTFYSGYTFNFPLGDTFFIQAQPSLFYKYSSNEFFKQIVSLSGKQRLVLERIHQLGIYLPLSLGIQVKHLSFMFRMTAIYIPLYYLDDEYYYNSKGNYVLGSTNSNFKYNSFGYSFGFLVKYTL